ncbi:MAG TPA: hypothetical protein VKT81_07170 [Bryobacteraceae bacterium]|nr:hypothetical protein [Bryobacteraceae bacterium]
MGSRFIAATAVAVTLFGCGQSLHETSTEIDRVKLRPFLNAVGPLIESGFGLAEIGQIEQEFANLAKDGTHALTFPIIYKGNKTKLRVTIRKEDSDIVEIRFFAVPQLVEQIEQVMKQTL